MSNGVILKLKILFIGPDDDEQFFKALNLLEKFNYEIVSLRSPGRGDTRPLPSIESWTGDYIFSYRSYYILDSKILSRAKIAAINFHPGPVEYPGSGCASWALYENAKNFGVTAHLMNEKIDNGNVLSVKTFPIEEQDDLTTLLMKAHDQIFELFVDVVKNIAYKGSAYIDEQLSLNRHINWVGNARKIDEINKLQSIDISMSLEDFKRILRATYTEKYPPFIEFYGYKFYLKLK